jgi:hypothetical protein
MKNIFLSMLAIALMASPALAADGGKKKAKKKAKVECKADCKKDKCCDPKSCQKDEKCAPTTVCMGS